MTEYEANVFHAWTLDGDVHVDIFGIAHDVEFMDFDYAENVLCWLLDNAQEFHRVYRRREEGIEPLELEGDALFVYLNESPKNAHHWMLRTELAQSLMRRLAG